jgi:hypothetical protein
VICGIAVTLYDRTQTGTDAFGAPVWEETPVEVLNVLPAPAAAEAVTEELALFGKRLAYTLHIPKGDDHVWEDRRVDFFGQVFRTYGPVDQYVEANVPGRWNRRVRVERYG